MTITPNQKIKNQRTTRSTTPDHLIRGGFRRGLKSSNEPKLATQKNIYYYFLFDPPKIKF